MRKDQGKVISRRNKENEGKSQSKSLDANHLSREKSVVKQGKLQRKSVDLVDHWAFLGEIEAPMWVDFLEESKYMDQDVDDAWFRIEHPFHQSCSHQLISAFGVSKNPSHNVSPRNSSIKFPGSISLSRGKHVNNRKWARTEKNLTPNKNHPIRMLKAKHSFTTFDSKTSQEDSSSTITSISTGLKRVTTSRDSRSSRSLERSLAKTGSVNFVRLNNHGSLKAKSDLKDIKGNLDLKEHITTFDNEKIHLTKQCTTKHASKVNVMKDRHSSLNGCNKAYSSNLRCSNNLISKVKPKTCGLMPAKVIFSSTKSSLDNKVKKLNVNKKKKCNTGETIGGVSKSKAICEKRRQASLDCESDEKVIPLKPKPEEIKSKKTSLPTVQRKLQSLHNEANAQKHLHVLKSNSMGERKNKKAIFGGKENISSYKTGVQISSNVALHSHDGNKFSISKVKIDRQAQVKLETGVPKVCYFR